MKILFLDQSGKPGGAELCLLDIAKPYHDRCLVGLLADGSFRELLEQHQIPVQVLTKQAIKVRKESDVLQGISSGLQLMPLMGQISQLSQDYDLIYANTQKALVVGTIASVLNRKPLVYHLHDILSPDHFSPTNRKIAVTFANRAALVIANSNATKTAFLEAGGRKNLVRVVYNGFEPHQYQQETAQRSLLRQSLGLEDRFVIGQFSRLSPWKGQNILVEALKHCPENVTALLVGDALFGEQAYVDRLHEQINQAGLENRIQFLGFRSDIPALMSACDLVTHTSIAPEPFGRVIVEAMLCGKPAVATAAGGAIELVEHGKTGWLVPPNDALALAEVINDCRQHPEQTAAIARQGQIEASQRFNLSEIQQQIDRLLQQVVGDT